ncbi:MAG: hypothetical protein AAGC44_10780 [Planctomycetota bacterium]
MRIRKWVKRAAITLMALVLVAVLITGYLYQRAGAAPEMWTKERSRISAMAPSQQQTVTERLRNRLINEWTAAEPSSEFIKTDSGSIFGQRRRFAIPYNELNVWLHVEGRALLENLGITLPARVQHAMVSGTADGNLVFAVEDDPGSGGRVYTLTFKIDIADDGTVTSRLISAEAGRLSLPPETAARLLASSNSTSPDVENLLNDMMTGNPVPPRDLTIDPGAEGARDGRIVGLEVDEQQIIVTRQTVRRGDKQAAD